MKQLILTVLSFSLSILFNFAANAEVKVIIAESSYVMGDNDSKIDARRIAIQEAKRKALEIGGTYVESLSQVKNYQLTKDEIKSYTAGVLETEIISEQLHGTMDHPEIYIKAQCKIDTNIVLTQIEKFRENEDIKDQLDATMKENDELRKERDALLTNLAADKDKTSAAKTRQKLDAVLKKEEANDETNKVWINIGPQLIQIDATRQEIKQADLDKSAVILQNSIKVNPQDQRARYLLASIYERKGSTSAAETELRTALQHNPSNLTVRMKLGVLLKDQGKYQGALREFHFVERFRPQNALMLFYTGMTFKQMGRCGKSVQYLNRFLINPRINNFPRKKDIAKLAVDDCGGDRPGRVRRSSQ
ncbi:MAG TPA: tetratricopeptide repeat protein [Nitrospirota bacterium]|nr:tetratricopeptide repeat protein [Nitrospirota bacterium]